MATKNVSLTYDTAQMTATMSNEFFTIKFNKKGYGYSMIDPAGTEMVSKNHGLALGDNGHENFTAASLKIVTDNPEMADIAYCSDWGEIHYVMRAGISGFYSYFVVANENHSLDNVGEFRTDYWLNGNIFRNGYNSQRGGPFPTLQDILDGQKLQDETWMLKDGTPYTKYDWADYEANDLTHGVYGTDGNKGYGAWLIPVSSEYYNGGPLRQELMVHVESKTGEGILLNMLKGSHFSAPAMALPKGYIYGPWLVYMNNGSAADARAQAAKERAQWPYKWLSNPNYPLSRTNVTGTLKLSTGKAAANAEVVLAQPGGDFYQQNGYIFYSQCDASGKFTIPNVRPGTYSLYAYATGGDIADEYEQDNIKVSGATLDLATVAWDITRHDSLLWIIGSADRKSGEFRFGDSPRQYGLPAQVPADLIYTVGSSIPADDWYYAQTKIGTWNIQFNLDKTYGKNAYLTIPVAGASRGPSADIYVNGNKVSTLDYSPDNDGATYRSATQSGAYRSNVISFPASLLKEGQNTVSLKMTKVSTDGGIMYDMLKLEADDNPSGGPAASSGSVSTASPGGSPASLTASQANSNPQTGDALGITDFSLAALASVALVVLVQSRKRAGR